MKNYAEQLRQVRDFLTPDNWSKGSYFKVKNNTLCMCVHGAGQALFNPEVKKALENNKVVDRVVLFCAPGAAESEVVYAGDAAGGAWSSAIAMSSDNARHDRDTNKDLLSIWSNRPDWIKHERIYNSISYGFVNLHFLMGLFGITVSFNDSLNTTLEMLKNKLSEAAKWAEENEEFLQNN